MLLLKQCRHIVQKVKYDQKIYVRKSTSLSPNLVPRVNTYLLDLLPQIFTFTFPSVIHNHRPLSSQWLLWFCFDILPRE